MIVRSFDQCSSLSISRGIEISSYPKVVEPGILRVSFFNQQINHELSTDPNLLYIFIFFYIHESVKSQIAWKNDNNAPECIQIP